MHDAFQTATGPSERSCTV